jgi:carbon-monoxide dehydrogenase small subunit
MRVALGPIKTSFKGRAQVAFEPALQEGVVTGQGRDARLGSSAEGQARWRVTAAEGNKSMIIVSLRWKLTGVLAQFNRGGLLRDIIRRLAADFATNLEASIAGQKAPAATVKPINRDATEVGQRILLTIDRQDAASHLQPAPPRPLRHPCPNFFLRAALIF